MSMPIEDFKKLLNDYVENEDVVITNARDFWEEAPVLKCLIHNKGVHILLKKNSLELLKETLDKSSDEDKFWFLQEFCADIDMPDTNLINKILKNRM